MGGGKIKDANYGLWKYKAPETARIFGFLMFKKKIMTHNVMLRCKMHCNPTCVLCPDCPLETAIHLLFECQYLIRVWSKVSTILGYRIRQISGYIQEIWDCTLRQIQYRYRDWSSRGPVLILCTCWHICRQRNAKIFEGDCQQTKQLKRQCQEQNYSSGIVSKG